LKRRKKRLCEFSRSDDLRKNIKSKNYPYLLLLIGSNVGLGGATNWQNASNGTKLLIKMKKEVIIFELLAER